MVSYWTVCHPDGKWKNMCVEEGQMKIIKHCAGSWEGKGELVMWVPLELCENGFHLGRLISSVPFSCLHTVRMHKWVLHPPTSSENANALGALWTQLLHTLHAERTEYCANQHSHGQPWRNTARALFAYFLKMSPGKHSTQVQFILHHRRIWSSFCRTSFQSAVSTSLFIILGKGWTKAPTGHGEAMLLCEN